MGPTKKSSRRGPLQPHQKAILTAGFASLILWALPGLHFAMLPLQYLNTHLHEMCHALMALATGGQPQKIIVRPDGSGVTPISGGNIILEASAGYVGATIIGAVIMWFGRTERAAKVTLRVVALALGVSMLLWVRGENVGTFAFGIGSAVFYVVALVAISIYVKGPNLLFATQFIGLQQCLNSAQALYVLVQLSAFTESQSDAGILQSATGIPRLVFAVAWCIFRLFTVGFVLRKAWAGPKTPS